MGALAYNPSDWQSPKPRNAPQGAAEENCPPYTVYYCVASDPINESDVVIITDKDGWGNWKYLAPRSTVLGTFDTLGAAIECVLPHYNLLRAAYIAQ